MDIDPPEQVLQLFFFAVAWDASLFFGLLLLVVLIVCSALISGSEVAYFSLSPSELSELEDEDSTVSNRVLELAKESNQLLASILVINNFINICIVVLSDYLLKYFFSNDYFNELAASFIQWIPSMAQYHSWLASGLHFIVTVMLVTFILVLFGEVTPKIYANIHNVSFAKFMSRPLQIILNVLSPLSKAMVKWGDRLENRVSASSSTTSKEDLDRAIEIAISQEDNSKEDLDILRGILKFGDVSVKEIMKSRVDVVAVDTEMPFDEILDIVLESGYSRIPVFKEDFDHVIGILYVKDLLGHTKEEKNFKWQSLIRNKMHVVPESKKINELLKEFQQRRVHMGMVVDEYGGTAGLVTLEDIMEEVIGDIKDEFDDEIEIDYEKIDEHNFVFEGKTLLTDFFRVVDRDSDDFADIKGDTDTLAGIVLQLSGKIPNEYEIFHFGDYVFEIEKVTPRRIEKIRITIPEKINETS